jgi:hypothetical protein
MTNSQILVEDTQNVIEVVNQEIRVMAVEQPYLVVLGNSGPQGPQGEPGETQVVAYVFTQNSPASSWTINHGLDFVPNITVVDTAGSVVEGDYSYPNENTIIATFSGAFAGKAYLS